MGRTHYDSLVRLKPRRHSVGSTCSSNQCNNFYQINNLVVLEAKLVVVETKLVILEAKLVVLEA
jgi:hypothetical protein